jgi:hypothetical protein
MQLFFSRFVTDSLAALLEETLDLALDGVL